MKTQHQGNSWEKFAGLQRSLSRLLPWLSLVWGIVSGFLISRDDAHTLRFLVFSIALLIFSGLLSLWFLWRKRVSGAETAPERGIAGLLHARAGLVEWAVLTGTQVYAQYLFMFSLPLLFFSKSWFFLVLTALSVASSLWDPWWVKLVKSEWYRTGIRTLALLLASSFFFALFLHKYLFVYRFYLAAIAILTVFPWHLSLNWRAYSVQKILPFASVLLLVAMPLFVFKSTTIPLLSVWVQDGRFALGQDPKDQKSRVTPSITRSKLKEILQGDGQICCVSPVVAPQGFESEVSQEWAIDGKVIDTISLPPVQGAAGEKSFRTYSCKKNFTKIDKWNEIECTTILGGALRVAKIRLIQEHEPSVPALPEQQ